MLVSVLSAGPAAGVPFDLEMLGLAEMVWPIRRIACGDNGNRYCGGVNPAAAFGGRDPLDSMAASFAVQTIAVRAVNLDGQGTDDAVLSAEPAAHADIGIQEVASEQAGIGAAFGSSNFNGALHGESILNPESE